MEAIVLAGGAGTRLKSVVHDVPKPMAPVAGKPFLDYILSWCLSQNVSRVIISAGYMHNVIIDNYGGKWGSMTIDYAVEDTPLGTGGGIKLALGKASQKDVFVINGDTWFPVSLGEMKKFHQEKESACTIAVAYVNDVSRYGTVKYDDSMLINAFIEKGLGDSHYINGGIYCLNRKFFFENTDSTVFSFEKEFLEKLVNKNGFYAYPSGEHFIDIGVPDDYFRAEKILISGFK